MFKIYISGVKCCARAFDSVGGCVQSGGENELRRSFKFYIFFMNLYVLFENIKNRILKVFIYSLRTI